ncbi:MAG: hypothetical protein Q9219_007426, partial [cf. Caloplaca sp. 3 TL-2023]
MSDIDQYMLNIDSDNLRAEERAKETARNLQSRNISLIDVVRSLGAYVNDEDTTIRSKAISYLSLVIRALPDKTLSRQQVLVLCQFLCDRIEDGGAISALMKLQSLERFNNEMVVKTFRALVEHFQNFLARPHSQRLQVLQLLNGLMLNHRETLKSLGDEAIIGITELVSGEKDPRSLMIVFSVQHVVMAEWDVASLAETLFDSVFCYFPITFHPPPDDPFGITAQDLKSRLRKCISASSHFAPFAFPQLIGKLDSTSLNVKRDALQTLSACTSSYNVAMISNYSAIVWDSLKYEILNAQEEDIADDALAALRTIAVRLGRGSTSIDQSTPLARYLKPITQDCQEKLQEPQLKQAKPAGHILSCLATSSSSALYLIIRSVIPALLTLYQDTESITNQKALLEIVVQMYGAAVSINQSSEVSSVPSGSESPLLPFKDSLFALFSRVLMSSPSEEVSFRMVALNGLRCLSQLRGHLQESEIGLFVQYLDEIVLTEHLNGRGELRNEAIEALIELSRLKPNLIADITIPALMARLPDQSTDESTDYVYTLEGLARLGADRSVSDTLTRRLLNKLETALWVTKSASYVGALLSSIDYVLSKQDLSADPNLDNYYEKIVVTLVRRTALASIDRGPQVLTEELEIIGRLAGRVISALDEGKRQSSASEAYTLYVGKESLFIPIPYSNCVSEKQRSTMVLSTWIMASVGPAASVFQSIGDKNVGFEKLLRELTRLAILESRHTTRIYILRQIALFVNRSPFAECLSAAFFILQNPLGASQLRTDDASSTDWVPVVFWIAKALLLRLSRTEEVLAHVLGLLANTIYGSASAQGFGVLLAPDEILSKQHGAVIRLLAKQKVFSICVPSIAGDFKFAESFTKTNYLTALTGILKYVPTDIMMMEVTTLLPLLLQSLDLPAQEVKAATIESLLIVGQESPEAIEAHVGTLANRLLQCAADTKGNTHVFPGKIKESVLLPFRSKIIKEVLPALDDPKRQ